GNGGRAPRSIRIPCWRPRRHVDTAALIGPLLFQQRRQGSPHVVAQLRLHGGGGVQVVVLVGIAIGGDRLQQERQQGDVESIRQRAVVLLEGAGVGRAQIGRHLHADQQH